MSELFTSTLILAAEFGAVISIFFLIFMMIVYIRRKKDTHIISDFTSKFRESTGVRRESLEQSVTEVFRVSGDEGQGAVNEIMNKERTICSNVLKIFAGKDKGLIMTLKDDLDGLSGLYHNLANLGHERSSPETTDGDVSVSGEEGMESDLNVLRTENQQLKQELKKSLENIDYLQAQYTELFEKTKR